jgi:hypothetical protein
MFTSLPIPDAGIGKSPTLSACECNCACRLRLLTIHVMFSCRCCRDFCEGHSGTVLMPSGFPLPPCGLQMFFGNCSQC